MAAKKETNKTTRITFPTTADKPHHLVKQVQALNFNKLLFYLSLRFLRYPINEAWLECCHSKYGNFCLIRRDMKLFNISFKGGRKCRLR